MSLHYEPNRKKQRGQWKKLEALCIWMEELTPFLQMDQPFEHVHIQCAGLLNHPKTSGKLKTLFCQKTIEITEKWIAQKPTGIPFCRVVAMIETPNFENSQLIIFYDQTYFDSFWKRHDEEQTWIPMSNKYSFSQSRGLKTALNEMGYHEVVIDEKERFESNLWFYGELPDNRE